MIATAPRPRVAVIGAGISGLGTAWALAPHAEVVVFESSPRAGGHAHTVDLTIDGVRHGVDIGFLVFNHATYPRLRALFDTLEVPTAASDMSFSVQMPATGLEWSGHSLDTVFVQRRNLLRPRFLGMLADLLRFNRLCSRIAERAEAGESPGALGSIEDFLDQHRFSAAFREAYLLPMLGCIWSCPTRQMLQFPALTMIRFCHNHGLIRVTRRPPWYTVRGGSREYVQRLLARLPDVRLGQPVQGLQRPSGGDAGVWLKAGGHAERFDQVVLACHSDQALALLGEQASAEERAVLGAIRYQANRAVLHGDERLLPRRSEERRVGKECRRLCRSRWSPYH
jgi:predicted NAD/FAD-binding protein